MPQISSSTAPNGLPIHRVALEGTRATTMLVAFDAGARTERPEENGMAHFLEHLVFKGGEVYDDYRKVNETAERMGGVAQRLHEPRPRRLPHHGARRGGDGGASTCSRTSSGARRSTPGARQGARRRHPGDPALQGPAGGRRRGAHRPRRVRRPPAGPDRARARGPPAHVHARGHRRLPRAPVVGRARRRVPRRQPRPRRPTNGAVDELLSRFPDLPAAVAVRARPRRSRPRSSSRSARRTSRTCG